MAHDILEEDDAMRARDWDFDFWRFMGGITFYPYQIALGLTLRYWPCIFAPAVRAHVGPFKFWLTITLKKRDE